MKFSIQAFNAGTFWVPGPEVYWMEAWNTREEMNIVHLPSSRRRAKYSH